MFPYKYFVRCDLIAAIYSCIINIRTRQDNVNNVPMCYVNRVNFCEGRTKTSQKADSTSRLSLSWYLDTRTNCLLIALLLVLPTVQYRRVAYAPMWFQFQNFKFFFNMWKKYHSRKLDLLFLNDMIALYLAVFCDYSFF